MVTPPQNAAWNLYAAYCRAGGGDPLPWPRLHDYEQASWLAVWAEAGAVERATVAPDDEALFQTAWQELAERDDRTSPEEYPEMALITYFELRAFMLAAWTAARGQDAEDAHDHDAIHRWFSLSYCSYLTLPRSVLQSMPQDWQSAFVRLLNELQAKASAAGIETPDYTIVAKDGAKFVRDPWRDYERGRRNVFRECGFDASREAQP